MTVHVFTWDSWSLYLAALCIWREARGEGDAGMQAVANVINNRIKNFPNQHSTPADVVTRVWQFSSMTAKDDPQLSNWPKQDDTAFPRAFDVMQGVLNGSVADNTNGATHYFNPGEAQPLWAKNMTKVATIGHHDFYKA